MSSEGFTPPEHLSEVEGNKEYREKSIDLMEEVANGNVSNETIADWLEASAMHLGSIATEWASRRFEKGSKFTEVGESRGGAVMFKDGTVKDLTPGRYDESELHRKLANGTNESGIVVNRTLINLADKLRYAPEDMGRTEIGQLKRHLQFYEDIFRKEAPERTAESPLQKYIDSWEQRRLELPSMREAEPETAIIETVL